MAREGDTDGADSRNDDAGDDADLLARSARGDRRAFDEIVTRYGPLALRIAGRMARDRQSAEDIAQEAMVRVWRRASEFDPRRARFSTWLYRIVVNLCIDPILAKNRRDCPQAAAFK
jgi:RNA polymerase sigma-70 factor (ECF subfamily)